MNKYRIRFSKIGRIKFIGHLDMLRVFQRSIIRSELPIQYSNGFNPHQKTSFALPLSLGMESEGEYIEIELVQELAIDEIANRLNAALPDGIDIIKVLHLKEPSKSAAAQVEAGLYEITFPEIDNLNVLVDDIMNRNEIWVTKKTKKGEREVDIRPSIHEIIIKSSGSLEAMIDAGSKSNLNPYVLVEVLFKHTITDARCKRLDLFANVDNKFISLQEV